MKIEKIDIKTKNKAHYTDIALLVGSVDFVKEVNSLREQLNILRLVPVEGSIPGSILSLNPFDSINIGVDDEEEKSQRFLTFNEGVATILKKFKRDLHFKKVVEYALLAGCIPNHVYSSCFFDIVKIQDSEMGIKDDEYEFVIRLSSRTSTEDLNKAFEFYQDYIKTKMKFIDYRKSEKEVSQEEIEEAKKVMEDEYEKYQQDIKLDTSLENSSKALSKFLKKTQAAHELFQSLGELNLEVPEHYEILYNYNKGIVNRFSDSTKNRIKKRINTWLQWYWIANRNIINGTSTGRLPSQAVLDEWEQVREACPLKVHKTNDEKNACEFCAEYSPSDVDKGLSEYNKILISQSN